MDKIKLANRSRKNRVLFDFLVLELVVEINLGTISLNRDLLIPTYVNHAHAGSLSEADNYVQLNRDTGCQFVPQGEALPSNLLAALDKMLREAPAKLKGCRSRKMITDYLRQHTDLTDCHFTALNKMQSFD